MRSLFFSKYYQGKAAPLTEWICHLEICNNKLDEARKPLEIILRFKKKAIVVLIDIRYNIILSPVKI